MAEDPRSGRSALPMTLYTMLVAVSAAAAGAQEIPRTWSDSAVAEFELPLAAPEYSPEHVSEDYYYALQERTIWKSYPIYHPDFEPEGYRDSLALLEPSVAFDASTLTTEARWREAGRLVFHAPIAYDGAVRPKDVLDPRWYVENQVGVTPDGILPWVRWVVREKGRLEVGNLSCAMCHTRLMPDGSTIEGAQGNFPFEWVTAWRIRQGDTPPPVVRMFGRLLSAAPWIEEPMRNPDTLFELPLEELAALRAAVPPGVLIRQGTAFDAPARIPDLIGIRDRKYLDATGLVVHRGPGDIMRYAAVNQTLDILARYGDYIPATASSELPPPGASPVPGSSDRYSEEQLFALAQFLYSLEPPPNPNRMDALARRGSEVFEAEGCGDCHTPPLYTNNRLVPVLMSDN